MKHQRNTLEAISDDKRKIPSCPVHLGCCAALSSCSMAKCLGRLQTKPYQSASLLDSLEHMSTLARFAWSHLKPIPTLTDFHEEDLLYCPLSQSAVHSSGHDRKTCAVDKRRHSRISFSPRNPKETTFSPSKRAPWRFLVF